MGKYIHCFETTADFEAEYYGNGYSEPWVSAIKNGGIAYNKPAPQYDFNGHEYVDLGLPSGTLWATCNVGANSPEQTGGYYAWGEKNTKTLYEESTYVYHSFDTVTENMGGDWRMPSIDDFLELFSGTVLTSETNGVRFTSKTNGNSMLVPKSGKKITTEVANGSTCRLWTGEICEDDDDYAWSFWDDDELDDSTHRYIGLPVRGVIKP